MERACSGFTIDVTDLRQELDRLSALGISPDVDEEGGIPVRAEINPNDLRGLRVVLRQVDPESGAIPADGTRVTGILGDLPRCVRRPSGGSPHR